MQTRSRVVALTLAGSAAAVAFAGVTVGAQTPDDSGSTTTLVEPTTSLATTTTLPGSSTTVPIDAENPFPGAALTFNAFLSSGQEVPATDSTAVGTVELSLDADASEISWTARVAGLTEATAGHLHLGPIGVNGPVVVPLFEEVAASGPFLEAEGTITADDLAGPLEGLTIDALVAQIAEGNIYANVHTAEHPDGEIRGQVLVWTVTGAEPTTSTTEPTTSTTGGSTTSTTGGSTTSTTGGSTTSTTGDATTTTTGGTTSTSGPSTPTTAGPTTSTTAAVTPPYFPPTPDDGATTTTS